MANTIEKLVIGELQVNNGNLKVKSATVGTMTAKSPETDAEAGYITIEINGTEYEVPAYAIA